MAVQEVATGIWLLAGQSHHSVVVEFADHLTLIEAPQSELRTMAVIARARELRPDKPLTQMVMSHHHFDHSGGFRAAVSEGLTVIVDKASVSFFEAVAKRPSTLAPDALARNPKPATIVGVDGEMVLSDKTMTVNLYLHGNGRSSKSMCTLPGPRSRRSPRACWRTSGGSTCAWTASSRFMARRPRSASS